MTRTELDSINKLTHRLGSVCDELDRICKKPKVDARIEEATYLSVQSLWRLIELVGDENRKRTTRSAA